MRRYLAPALVPALLLAAGDARAKEVATINPGVLLSGVAGGAPAFGVGGELSFMVFPHGGKIQEEIGLGGFAQAQLYNGDRGRYALGVQAGSVFGVELGYAYREMTHAFAGEHAVHAALFGSMGFVVLALRTSVPVATEGEDATHPSPGFEVALSFAFKLPILIGDVDVVGNLPSGRALRDGGRVVVAGVEARRGFARGPAPRVFGLGGRGREALARAWLADGLAEHASVASFVRLAAELDALGAPRPLVDRALGAAREEARHARMCFALASAYAGVDLAPGSLPPLAPRRAPLALLAAESLADGCVGEAAASRSADEARGAASDEAVRAVLGVIARDEASHARLAWDVVSFAASRGVAPRPRDLELDAAPAGSAPCRATRAHGRLGERRARAIVERVRGEARRDAP